MLLSIVIPVYNVEKYIERCIRSCFDQDLNQNSYELVVVDDESPDNSVQIVEQLFGTFENIRIIRQKNKGLGGARNTGIQEAKGDYILFLDSDDYLNTNVLKQTTTTATSNQLDILDFGAQGVDETGKIVYKIVHTTKNKILNGLDYYQVKFHNSACVRLYKRKLLTDNCLLFKEKIYVEDVEFNSRVFFYSKKVMAIPLIVSNFYQNRNSITRKKSDAKIDKMIHDVQYVIESLARFTTKAIVSEPTLKAPLEQKIEDLASGLLFYTFINTKHQDKLEDIINFLTERKILPFKYKALNKKKKIFYSISQNLTLLKTAFRIKNIVTL